MVNNSNKEEFETLECEKIVDHIRVDDKIIYLVKWQDSAFKDWVSIDNFNTMEIINKFHQKLEADLEKPAVQKKLLRKYANEPSKLVASKRKAIEVSDDTYIPAKKTKRNEIIPIKHRMTTRSKSSPSGAISDN